jgi:hypothetical protein
MAVLLVDVVFLSPKEGGRQLSLPVFKYPAVYRPHLVAQDRSVRQARMRGNVIKEDYWAVSFIDGPADFGFGESIRCRLSLDWFPETDYAPLVKGASFTVREGPRIVGHGVVLDRSDAN